MIKKMRLREKQRVRLYAKQCCRQSIRNSEILQGLRETFCYYRQVDVVNEAVRLILLYNKTGNKSHLHLVQ